ncbi:MAG TPA: hypothetical protein VGH63_09880, partial [Polyangia bacterium]
LGPLTDQMMSGTLIASNEGGANTLECKGASFVSGPLAGVFPNGINVRKTGAALTASAQLDVAALGKFLPAGVTPSGGLTLDVHKEGADKLHITPSGTVGVSIGGDLLSATLALAEEEGGIGATITADVKARPPGVNITGHAVVKIDAQKKVSLQEGSSLDVDMLAGTVTAKITPILDGGKISGVSIAGNVKDTQFTNATPFTFQYNNGSWGADATISLKAIPGILQGGTLSFGYSSTGGFHAHAESIPLSGALQGLSIDEAHLDGKSYGATISGGKDITVGSVKIGIDGSSKLSFDSQSGLTGTAKGNVKLGPLPQINVSVTANGNTAPIDIHADTDIPLDKISQFLAGNLNVKYDRNAGANAFGFKATDVQVNADPIKSQVLFSTIEAHWDGANLTGKLTAATVNVKAGPLDVTVDGGTIDLLAGNVLNGDLKAHMTAGGSNAHAGVGWEMGKFKWEAGGVVQLGGVTNHMLEGEVEASASSGGNAAIKTNGAITFGASAPEPVKTLSITSLTGNVRPGHTDVHLHIEAAAAINKLTSGMQDLHVEVGHAPVVIDYVGGVFGMSAHVKGTA